MKLITNEFWNWIKPLLQYPEDQILLRHTRMKRNGFGLSHKYEAQKKYKLSRSQIEYIMKKLEWLAILYELEVASFPDTFSHSIT